MAWVAVPALTQPNAPLDVINHYFWGRQWQWGYHKHPPLPAWLTTLAADYGPGDWLVYLVSQLFILACLWAAWRLAREWFPPRVALLAPLLLEASHYYTYDSPELNHNIAVMGFWAVAVLMLRYALTRGRVRDWLGLGLALGLGLQSKYSIAFLGLTMIAYLLVDPDARQVWRRPGPYLALLLSFLIFVPHLRWAQAHDWITLRYAASRGGGEASPWAHLLNPLEFVGAQGLGLLPVLLAALPILARRGQRQVTGADGRFLDWVLWGPVALHLLLSWGTGLHLRSMWGSALWTFFGLWLLARLPTCFDPPAVRRAAVIAVIFGLGFLAAAAGRNLLAPVVQPRGERIHFPGRQLAQLAEQRWRERFDGPLPMVAGPWWIAGNVAYYASDHPEVYGDFDRVMSPWSSDDELRRRGGLIVWQDPPEHESDRIEDWLARFPSAERLPPVTLAWQGFGHPPPLRFGMAMVPPADRG